MSASNYDTIRQALRKHLHENAGTGAASEVATDQECLDIAGELSAFSSESIYFPEFKVAGSAVDNSTGNEGPSSVFTYTSDEPKGSAWIRLSTRLVSDLFTRGLGGQPSPVGETAEAALTAAEIEFATLLAGELSRVVAVALRSAKFEKADHERLDPDVGAPEHTQRHFFSAELADRNVVLEVGISKAREPQVQPVKSATLGAAAQKVTFAPQVRVRLKPMMVGELAGLRRGDILAAEIVAGNLPASLHIDGKPILECEMGQVGNRYSVRIRGSAAGNPSSASSLYHEGGR